MNDSLASLIWTKKGRPTLRANDLQPVDIDSLRLTTAR
jgi:hypothetical protein